MVTPTKGASERKKKHPAVQFLILMNPYIVLSIYNYSSLAGQTLFH